VTTAYVGVGSNLNDPRAQVLQAFTELDGLPHTRVVRKSSLYRSAPMGHAAQPDFVNAVAQASLDLNLLLYGTARIASPALTVPHPRMHERAFVLKPLLEIAPQLPFTAQLDACADQEVERID